MKTASAKNKGRTLQKWVRDILTNTLGLASDEISSRSSGAGGEDLLMSTTARERFPMSVECKNQERVNVWEAYAQAGANADQWEPLLIIKRNHHKPLAVVDAEYFIGLFK